jgi:hypothetical protein
MSVILALRKLKQEEKEFKASLGYLVNSRPAQVTYQDHVSKQKYIYIFLMPKSIIISVLFLVFTKHTLEFRIFHFLPKMAKGSKLTKEKGSPIIRKHKINAKK